MTSNNNDCNLVQESIAWGKELTGKDKEHFLKCEKCNIVATQFEELDSLMKNESINIPSDFADRVMFKIDEREKQELPSIFKSLILLLDNSICKWGIGGIGFLLAFSAH
ncbi:MAG: hypothetical protein H7281_14215 [Bacteriovorax sp.]|nr:hypothetical protein [Bacteriovorax sp.]